MNKFNISGRRPEGSQLMAIYIDQPTQDDFLYMHPIIPKGYAGALGDSKLDLIGFDAAKIIGSRLQFWLINQRPPVGIDGRAAHAPTTGANVTVEVFAYGKGAKEMVHIKTIANRDIYSGNGIALTEDGGFLLTNDHSGKGE